MKEGTGRLFVVTAPSGAGKTSLSRELVGQVPALRYSISHTTRAPRGEEHTNGDYHFVDRVTFQRMIDQGEFAEWAEVHGHFYGTSLNEIDRARWEKTDLLLDIEGKGATQIREKNPDAVLIFIIAPSVEDLRARLYGRAEDTAEEIERRIQHVRNEVSYLPTYDYVVINQDFDEALLNLMSIIYAERSRRALMADRLPEDFRPE